MDVTFNRANEGFVGILVDGFDNYIYANRTRLNFLGLVSFNGEDNIFDENDSRYNRMIWIAKTRRRVRVPSSTANTWVGNYGYDDDPDGICLDLSND